LIATKGGYQQPGPVCGSRIVAEDGALVGLPRQKDPHVGISNVSVERIERARRVVHVALVQDRHNIADRTAEDFVRYCQQEGIAFICWRRIEGALLASGALFRDVALAPSGGPRSRSRFPGCSIDRQSRSPFQGHRRWSISRKTWEPWESA
jgi:hypothetical protein